MEAETRPSLLLRLRDAGDQSAWEQFVRVYTPLVYHAGRRRGLEHADAEDVTQHVFTRVLRGIRAFQYDRTRGRFRDWLGAIVRNETYRFLNGATKVNASFGDTPPEPTDNGEDPEWLSQFQSHLLSVALEEARPHFEEDTWRAFEAVWLESRPVPDVATAMNRSLDWVYVAKSRVLKRLWQTVQNLTDDLPLANGIAK